ncbi:MAG: hypothetical protein J5602_12300, partial [Clostridia bacterium]|nr:hypothetical protein [Clostridia bacterium]
FSATASGGQTNVGSSSNIVSSYNILQDNGDGTASVVTSYFLPENISTVNGTLTVTNNTTPLEFWFGTTTEANFPYTDGEMATCVNLPGSLTCTITGVTPATNPLLSSSEPGSAPITGVTYVIKSGSDNVTSYFTGGYVIPSNHAGGYVKTTSQVTQLEFWFGTTTEATFPYTDGEMAACVNLPDGMTCTITGVTPATNPLTESGTTAPITGVTYVVKDSYGNDVTSTFTDGYVIPSNHAGGYVKH